MHACFFQLLLHNIDSGLSNCDVRAVSHSCDVLTVDVVVKKWFMNNKARHIFMAAFASQVRDTLVWTNKTPKRQKGTKEREDI